jgi:hypothetical protein
MQSRFSYEDAEEIMYAEEYRAATYVDPDVILQLFNDSSISYTEAIPLGTCHNEEAVLQWHAFMKTRKLYSDYRKSMFHNYDIAKALINEFRDAVYAADLINVIHSGRCDRAFVYQANAASIYMSLLKNATIKAMLLVLNNPIHSHNLFLKYRWGRIINDMETEYYF